MSLLGMSEHVTIWEGAEPILHLGRVYHWLPGATPSEESRLETHQNCSLDSCLQGPYKDKLIPSAKQRYLEKLSSIQSYYTMQEFKSHKSLESYETFCCGWVQDLQASRGRIHEAFLRQKYFLSGAFFLSFVLRANLRRFDIHE